MASSDRRRGLAVAVGLLLLASALLLWRWSTPQASLEHLRLSDDSALTLVDSGQPNQAQVMLAVPAEHSLSDAQLLALSRDNGARVVQLTLTAGTCATQQQRLHASLQHLQGPASLVAGIGPGAAMAWRWLATQPDDQAQALSVAFSLNKPDCSTPLPQQASHGHWLAVWNDNPDDRSARFARQQSNAQTSISDYQQPLAQVLDHQLRDALQGHSSELPIVEVPATAAADTIILFYSGDGGWRDLDRAVAAELANLGYSLAGIDSLRYFWQHKSPTQSATDLARLMQTYRDKWGAKRFVLAGYSFGADVLPALYNQLPTADQAQIDALILLAFARSASFQIEVQGWLGKAGQETVTGAELARLPAAKVFCVYGREDAESSGCTLPQAPGEKLALPGGHHFDENYPVLAERLVQAIKARQKVSKP